MAEHLPARPLASYAPGDSIPELLCSDDSPPLLHAPKVLPASFCPACGSDELITPTRSGVTRMRCNTCNFLIASWRPGMKSWHMATLVLTTADAMQSVLSRMNVESERSHNHHAESAHTAGDKLLCEALLVAVHGTGMQLIGEAMVERYEAMMRWYA